MNNKHSFEVFLWICVFVTLREILDIHIYRSDVHFMRDCQLFLKQWHNLVPLLEN